MAHTRNLPLAALLLALATGSTPSWAQVAEGAAAPSVAPASTPALALPAAEAPNPVLAADYVSDLREIIDATLVYRYISSARGLDLTKVPAADREFELAFRRQMTQEELTRQLVPAYARVFAPAQARQLAQAMHAPVFRKREQLAFDLPGAAPALIGASFTAAERAELVRLSSAPVWVTWKAQQAKLGEAVREVTRNMGAQYGRQISARALAALRKVDADLKAANAAGNGVTIKIDRVGLSYMDKIVWTVGSSMIRLNNAYGRFDRALERSGFVDVLKPTALADKAGRAHSREVVENAETLLNALMAEADAAFKEREEGLRAIDFVHKEEYMKHLNQSLGGIYGFMIDYGEANRRVLDEYRRTLAFCDEREGKLHLQDGRLMFENDADLQAARQVFGQVDAARDALRRMVDAQNQRDDAMLQGKRMPAGG
jgi:hypothetical protein